MKLDVIELQVGDFEKSVKWYSKLFKPLHKEKDFAMFNTGGAVLALWKGKKNKTTLYFKSDKLKKSHTSLKKKGIKVSPITKVHWGKKFFFKDLEGNKHFVYEE